MDLRGPRPDLERHILPQAPICFPSEHLTSLPPKCSFMRATAAGGKRNLVVDVMLRTLGLDICADTLVRQLRLLAGWLAAFWCMADASVVASCAELAFQAGVPSRALGSRGAELAAAISHAHHT